MILGQLQTNGYVISFADEIWNIGGEINSTFTYFDQKK